MASFNATPFLRQCSVRKFDCHGWIPNTMEEVLGYIDLPHRGLSTPCRVANRPDPRVCRESKAASFREITDLGHRLAKFWEAYQAAREVHEVHQCRISRDCYRLVSAKSETTVASLISLARTTTSKVGGIRNTTS